MFDLLARLGLTTPRVGGIMPFSTVRTALMTADSPLAASLWPMFVLTFSLLRVCRTLVLETVLTAPIKRGSCPGNLFSFMAFATACTSSGSPTAVPVPWHSK